MMTLAGRPVHSILLEHGVFWKIVGVEKIVLIDDRDFESRFLWCLMVIET